jgi:hypothetical protein
MPRFIMFVYPGPYEGSPPVEAVEQMTRYNEELVKAGALLAADGITPPDEGASVVFPGGRASVVDGPYAEAKELVGGYWIIQAATKEEAVEWASRAPMGDGDRIEVRRLFDMEDHPEDVQEAAQLSTELPESTGGWEPKPQDG